MTKKPTTKPAPQADTTPTPEVQPAAPVLTPDLIRQLRGAESIDAGVSILLPTTTRKAKVDATYVLADDCQEPLPQRRGACLKVVTVAARLDRPFKVEDIAAALPDVKAAAYWTRKLAKTGHLKEVTA